MKKQKEYTVTFITRVYQDHIVTASSVKEAKKKAEAELDDGDWNWEKGYETYVEELEDDSSL